MKHSIQKFTLIFSLLFLTSFAAKLTFTSPQSENPSSFALTETSNGKVIRIRKAGWVASDAISTKENTTVYVTITHIAPLSTASIGITELAGEDCSPPKNPYPKIWSHDDKVECYFSEILTLFTKEIPYNALTEIREPISQGKTYKWEMTPYLGTEECMDTRIAEYPDSENFNVNINSGGMCEYNEAGNFYHLTYHNFGMFFELDTAGSVEFCVQTEEEIQLARGDCHYKLAERNN